MTRSAILLALVCSFIYAFFKKRTQFLGRLRTSLDDTAILAIGAYGIAAINFILAVIVDQIRLNGYDDRYLTLTNLFGPVRLTGGFPDSQVRSQVIFTRIICSAWLPLGGGPAASHPVPRRNLQPSIPTARRYGPYVVAKGSARPPNGKLLGYLRFSRSPAG